MDWHQGPVPSYQPEFLGEHEALFHIYLARSVHKMFTKKISTHLLIMEVDFCPVLCILEVPVLQAFRGISHFVWYCKAVSDLS